MAMTLAFDATHVVVDKELVARDLRNGTTPTERAALRADPHKWLNLLVEVKMAVEGQIAERKAQVDSGSLNWHDYRSWRPTVLRFKRAVDIDIQKAKAEVAKASQKKAANKAANADKRWRSAEIRDFVTRASGCLRTYAATDPAAAAWLAEYKQWKAATRDV